MKLRASFVVLLSLSCALAAFGQRGRRGGAQGREQQPEQPPAMDKVTPEIPGVVHAGTKIEIVKYGYRRSDSGLGLPDGSVLVSLGDSILKFDPNGHISTLVTGTEQAAGLTRDREGRVIAAEYSRKVAVIYPSGSAQVLTDSFDGKPYIRPNDLIADKKGGIYFTDCYQLRAKHLPGDLPQSVYYITPKTHKVIRVASDIGRPNGITLSPDGKTLYVNDWDGAYLVAYEVQPDGTLKNRRNFGKYTLKQKTDHGLVSGADGLCADNEGHTFAATPAGIQVFNAQGEHLGDIPAPYPRPPQNCGFGGPGRHYLYVTGRGVVYRIRTLGTGIKDQGK
jgi:gluconolactonase